MGWRVDPKTADPVGEEPVWVGDTDVGYTSPGADGHTVGYALAIPFPKDAAA